MYAKFVGTLTIMSFHASVWLHAARALLCSYGAASGHVGPKSFPGAAPRRLRFPLSGRCTIQRDCKLPPIKAYQKALPPDTVQYIGIAADEPKRLARLKPGQISLLDKYHVAEPEARSMCAAEGLLSPLYDFTKRGGCWFCPNASISELRHLYRYHPELWQLLLELQDVPNKPTERFSWRRTFREIDERFRQEGEQLSFYEER